jgi:hypothetical protein
MMRLLPHRLAPLRIALGIVWTAAGYLTAAVV